MTPPYPPTTALVAKAWMVANVEDLTAADVATRLPRETSAWATKGFVQITPVTGRVNIDVQLRRPLVQVDLWAINVSASGAVSDKPASGKANRLGEMVLAATETGVQQHGHLLDVGPDYADARVLGVYPESELVEVLDDPSGYTRFTIDLAFDWARA